MGAYNTFIRQVRVTMCSSFAVARAIQWWWRIGGLIRYACCMSYARLRPIMRRAHADTSITGLAPHETEQDARFVAELCRDWGVPCTVERADVPAMAPREGPASKRRAAGALCLSRRYGARVGGFRWR